MSRSIFGFCALVMLLSGCLATVSPDTQPVSQFASLSNTIICDVATLNGAWETRTKYKKHVQEAKRRGLSCGVSDTQQVSQFAHLNSYVICEVATLNGAWETRTKYKKHVQEAKRRGLSCGVENSSTNNSEKTPNRLSKLSLHVIERLLELNIVTKPQQLKIKSNIESMTTTTFEALEEMCKKSYENLRPQDCDKEFSKHKY